MITRVLVNDGLVQRVEWYLPGIGAHEGLRDWYLAIPRGDADHHLIVRETVCLDVHVAAVAFDGEIVRVGRERDVFAVARIKPLFEVFVVIFFAVGILDTAVDCVGYSRLDTRRNRVRY